MEVDAMTYFYPGKGWKGEFGFDWFRMGGKPDPLVVDSKGAKEGDSFDNIGLYVSPALCNIYLEGRFFKEGWPVYTQKIDHERLFPMRGENVGTDSDLQFARFNIKRNKEVIQEYALCENDECYYYVNIPFVNRRKMVDFDFWISDERIQHFLVWYDDEGKVEELTIVSGVIDKQASNGGKPDWQLETRVFTNGIDEVLAEDNVELLHLDTKLIERIYKNEDMVSDSLSEGDEQIMNAVVACPTSEILVTYGDHRKVAYRYEAAQLCKVTYMSSDGNTAESFSGSQEQVINKVKEANIPVIDELLTNPFYNHPASVHQLDEESIEVKMLMMRSSTVKCKLEVEQVTENASYVDLEHNETKDFDIKVLKVIGGKASVPRGWDNGRIRYEEVDYGGGADLTDGVLVPLWRQHVDHKYFVKHCDDKNIFYPIPSLALVNYSWSDKTRGLENDVATLQMHTLGDKKVKIVVDNEDALDIYLPEDSDAITEGTITLVANESSEKVVRLSVTDGDQEEDEDSVVGNMNVHVFSPIHMKICVVNVNFVNPRSGESLWNYKKDRFVEILGQAGIIFDEIDDSKSLSLEEKVFSGFERWDDNLGDFVIDRFIASHVYEKGLNNYIDEEFLNTYPEYTGYLRVYVLDKFLVDVGNEMMPRLVTALLDSDKPPLSSLTLFKRSIETSGITEGNPLARAMLRCLGLKPFADPDSNGDDKLGFQYGTSTNMMDGSEYRFTLTSGQWLTIRSNADTLRGRLQYAESKVKSKN